MIALLKSPQLLGLVLVASLAVAGGSYVKGRVDGRSIGRAEQLQATFDQLKERDVTNEKVRGLSDDRRCDAIGGVFVNGVCQ